MSSAERNQAEDKNFKKVLDWYCHASSRNQLYRETRVV